VRGVAVLLSSLIIAVGCGGTESEDSTAASPMAEVGTTHESTTTTPTTTAEKKSQGAGGWSDEIVAPYAVSNADVYTQARTICKVFTPKQVAAEYGSKSDPVSAAEKYAEVSFQPVFKQPAFEGCLKGFGVG
jgi:hypothetical protein